MIDTNLYVGGKIYCNGLEWSAIDSMIMEDAIICGTATFCNAHLEGILSIGTNCSNPYVFTDIEDSNLNEIPGALMIDTNLYVGGKIYCNGLEWSAIDSMIMEDAIICGTMTLCNTNINGLISFGNEGSYRSYSNITESNVNNVTGTLVVNEDIYVGGRMFCNGFTMTATNLFNTTMDHLNITSNIVLNYGLSNPKWTIELNNNGTDLLFKSINNTRVVLTDDFTSSVLNFTGHHLVTMNDIYMREHISISDYIGKIVISIGKYSNLQNRPFIDIDDAIPVVELSKKQSDCRVFGVISDIEKTDKNRSYNIGNLKFMQDKDIFDIKVRVNSVGEGGIWVTNYNGNFKNGDLITTCCLPGYGSKQKHHTIMSYTIAKITCDCKFKLNSDVYRCDEFIYKGKKYRKAFVGCIYKC